MRCWCARCKAVVPVVQWEHWGTDERGAAIVRGNCATCGAAIGEIGVYTTPATRRQAARVELERAQAAVSAG